MATTGDYNGAGLHPTAAGYQPINSWSDLSPPRVYAEDAARSCCSRSAAAIIEQQRGRVMSRDNGSGCVMAQYLDSSVGWLGMTQQQRGVMPSERAPRGHDGDGHQQPLREQILEAAREPQRAVQSRVGAALITDEWHSAYSHTHPQYLAYAKAYLPAQTLLGFYGGVIKLESECVEQEIQPSMAGRALELLPREGKSCGGHEAVVIDANHRCNELAMANDFRTNIDAPDVAWCQDRRPNAEPLVVWLATEPVPRVAIVTTRALSHGEEITMDYGAQYWLRRAEPQLRSILRAHPSVGAASVAPISSTLSVPGFLSAAEVAELSGDGQPGRVVLLSAVLCDRLASVLGVPIRPGSVLRRELHTEHGPVTRHVDQDPADGSALSCDSAIIYLHSSAQAALVVDDPTHACTSDGSGLRVSVEPGTLVRLAC